MRQYKIIIAVGLLAIATAATAEAQILRNFTGTAPNNNWYDTNNWTGNFVPSRDFDEVGIVNDNHVAYVDAPMADTTFGGSSANPGEVRVGVNVGLGSGSALEIRSGGTFRVQPGVAANGNLTVGGQGSSGTFTVLPGATVTVDGTMFENNTVAPALPTQINVGAASGSGTATLNVGAAVINTTLRTFANSDFNSLGTMTFSGTGNFRPEIKSGSNAKVDVTGSADLGGTMTLDFNGFTPTFGQNWTVLEASSFNFNFNAVTSPILGPGQVLVATKVPVAGRQQLKVTYNSALVLNVNRDNGAVSLGNPNSPNIPLDGYSIRSASGRLNTTNWNSLDDQNALGGDWRESNIATTQLAELKPTTFGTITGNTTQTLGTPYSPLASAFAAPEDLTFDYTQTDGSVVQGTVIYSGTTVNNLLLQIDPGTGHAKLRNTSQTTVSIDGYDIASVTGSLSTSGWSSLDDQNAAGGDWRESDIGAGRLAELKPSASTSLGPGASFDLGSPFSVAGTKDLVFSFLQAGSSFATTGAVIYAPLGVLGDYNNNGIVDAADYTIWRDHLGQTFALVNRDPTNSGVINSADYTFWKSHFGMISGSGGGSGLAGSNVPEPTSCLMLAIGGLLGCLIVRRRN
jgi:hypothetical protein